MNRIITIFALLLVLAMPVTGEAKKVQTAENQVAPLMDAYIKYEQSSWQNFEFSVAANLAPTELKYQWTIDEKELYETEIMKAFLSQGEHVIKVRVEDRCGNVVYDNVKLDIRFWSLHNNWIWWLLYLIVVCIIVYYWIVKLVYLLNRKRVSRQVREFMDLLDEHGWVERIITGESERKTTVSLQHQAKKNKS